MNLKKTLTSLLLSNLVLQYCLTLERSIKGFCNRLNTIELSYLELSLGDESQSSHCNRDNYNEVLFIAFMTSCSAKLSNNM